MTEIAPIVAEKWSIELPLADELCRRFESGDTFFFLTDYQPEISAQTDCATLASIYDFLSSVSELASKRKRVANAFKKAELLTKDVENRINQCVNSHELDDMLIPLRPNPRSRAQVAIGKGLGRLADILLLQEIEDRGIEEITSDYLEKNRDAGTIEDAVSGARDIFIESFAYDETVRTMVRAFGRDDGYIEVTPRNKKDREFIAYRGKMVPVKDVKPEEYLRLLAAEGKKQVRIKHGVQLFRITELLRHHFIVNPDSTSFDLICEAIEECWSRFLQSIVEESIRDSLRARAEEWVFVSVSEEIDRKIKEPLSAGTVIVVGAAGKNECVAVAFGADGNLLGASRDRVTEDGTSARFKQFFGRYHSECIIIFDNGRVEEAAKMLKSFGKKEESISIRAGTEKSEKLAGSEWMSMECAYLDDDMRLAYAAGLIHIQPLRVIVMAGAEYFDIHPLQKLVDGEKIARLLNRKMAELALRSGVSFLEIAASPLLNMPCVSRELLENVRKQGVKEKFSSKKDMLRVEGMTETVFRNISGYIYFPAGVCPLDRTLVHPDHYAWVEDMGADLGVPVESLVNEPEQLRALQFDNFAEKVFVERRLIGQLAFGKQFSAGMSSRARKRLNLTDLSEGSVVSGRVTNIALFGVFVDINAVCDGLVHISQLTDGYVETAEQVVNQGDHVNVRIVNIDRKKRRVSLSMKGMGEKAPKVRPSRYQLSSLADHFKNR